MSRQTPASRARQLVHSSGSYPSAAMACGLSPCTLSRIANGHTTRLPHASLIKLGLDPASRNAAGTYRLHPSVCINTARQCFSRWRCPLTAVEIAEELALPGEPDISHLVAARTALQQMESQGQARRTGIDWRAAA